MSKFYLPYENVDDYFCYEVLNSETIRAYKTEPLLNELVEYDDFFVNTHYLVKNGYDEVTSAPVCLDKNIMTNDVYYRNDFSSILVMTFILLIICFYFPYKMFSRMFGRWLKL